MKDILLKGKDIKRELLWFLGCVIVAFGMNIYAIVSYDTQWNELWNYWHVVFALSVVLFILVGLIRSIYAIVRKGILAIRS